MILQNDNDMNGVALSFDHKPTSREEEERIRKAGGFIASSVFEGGHYRVHVPWVSNGLGVARSFGDFPMSPAVGNQPYLSIKSINSFSTSPETKKLGTPKYILMGSDGIWDVIDNQQAAAIVGRMMKSLLFFFFLSIFFLKKKAKIETFFFYHRTRIIINYLSYN